MVELQVVSGLKSDPAADSGAAIEDRTTVGRVALLGVDAPGLRPRMLVAQGDQVAQGQPVFVDRAHPAIVFVAPVAGTIESISYGLRRTLSSLIIRIGARSADPVKEQIQTATAEGLRAALLARGLWPAFLTRPFGRIPAPEAKADAIFVTVTGDNRLAPDPRVVLAGQIESFRTGLRLLALLTDGTVHVCQTPGPDLSEGLGERVRAAFFASGAPSGLAGTHVHRLHPVGLAGRVWTIGYQDVAAIGTLAETGIYDPGRVVSLCGPRVARPRLLRTVAGANVMDLIGNETVPGRDGAPLATLSGTARTGRPAAWLGRYHQQITVLDGAAPRAKTVGRGLRWWFGQERAGPGPLIPTAALERALSLDILPVPLLRALSVGDAETARKLGCLELVEEDVAALSHACSSGADYGRMLRHVLDELAEDA